MSKFQSRSAADLADVMADLMAEKISPAQSRIDAVASLWSQMLPAELAEHCGIAGICGGQLKVWVDAPAYMYELQLRSAQLLDDLRLRCPRAKIQRLKLALR